MKYMYQIKHLIFKFPIYFLQYWGWNPGLHMLGKRPTIDLHIEDL